MAKSMPKIGAHEIRKRFLDFFGAREHQVVKSSPLVPQNDPTLLFVNAGMVQFKDVFTGRETRDYTRATSSQRCLRAGGKHNDLDNVGFTPRHHTMFEMLGNFSFGDYFKADAIKWAWEFLTGDLGIPKERLVVSIYNGEGKDAPYDTEARDIWAELLPADRIYALHDKENFWQMGDSGPCGPCSEIHIFHGDLAPGDAGKEGRGPGHEDDKYTELWNLVFMQYELENDKIVGKLPKPSIDTGAGLERLATVLAGVQNNYETELLAPIVQRAKRAVGTNADSFGPAPFQVIADHARATAFLIADGVFPDKTGREYVLRRIMRRAIRFGHQIGLQDLFMHDMCNEVVEQFATPFPELVAARATIEEVVKTEEAAFRRTLSRGLKKVQVVLEELEEGSTAFPVEDAGRLYDTFGFPIDLTGVIAKENDLTLDEEAVADWIKAEQGGGAEGPLGSDNAVGDLYFELEKETWAKAFEFRGYASVEGEAQVVALINAGQRCETVNEGQRVEVVLDHTPFYAESGGQVGDRGVIESEAFAIEIEDTVKPTANLHVHRGRVTRGSASVGKTVHARVDEERRDSIRRNHSATHLLHHALRAVLGEHVTQKGSLVAPDRLRFDFSHGKSLTPEQRQEIEDRVNKEVWANAATDTREMALDDAKASGAMGLFGEKYDDEVRVVSIGRESVELCGGNHVRRAGDIGAFTIVSEGGIAQGVRRIEAVTGLGALRHLQKLASVVANTGAALHAGGVDEVESKLEKLLSDHKERAREITDLKRKLATGGGGGDDEVAEVAGIKLLVKHVGEADPKTMRAAADTLRDRIKSGVVVLGGSREGKASLLVGVTKDLTDRVHAGKLVGKLAAHVDGRGGGRPEMAQAGGSKVEGIPQALAAASAALAELLG